MNLGVFMRNEKTGTGADIRFINSGRGSFSAKLPGLAIIFFIDMLALLHVFKDVIRNELRQSHK
jgi:hypothetical protein